MLSETLSTISEMQENHNSPEWFTTVCQLKSVCAMSWKFVWKIICSGKKEQLQKVKAKVHTVI